MKKLIGLIVLLGAWQAWRTRHRMQTHAIRDIEIERRLSRGRRGDAGPAAGGHRPLPPPP